MSKFAAYEKVLKCIKSSETNRQWIGSLKMIQLHYKMYKDEFLNRSMRHEHNVWLEQKVKQDKKK